MDVQCRAKKTGQHRTPGGKRNCPVCSVPPRRSSIAQAKPELGGRIKKNSESVHYLDTRGELHREGGPALVEYHSNGELKREAWLHHGKMLDRGDEPNEITRDRDGEEVRQHWYASSETESGISIRQLHREDGPALVAEGKNTETREWQMRGKRFNGGPDGEARIVTNKDTGETIKQEWDVPEGGTGLVSRHRPTISPSPNEVWMVKGERMGGRSKAYHLVTGVPQDNADALEYLYQFPIEELTPDHPSVSVATAMFSNREV